MDGETKRGHPTRQSDRPHAWKGGGIDQLRLETVSLTTANMCQGNGLCAILGEAYLGAWVAIYGIKTVVDTTLRHDYLALPHKG